MSQTSVVEHDPGDDVSIYPSELLPQPAQYDTTSSSSSSDEYENGLDGVYWSEEVVRELRPVRAPKRFTDEFADEIAEVYRKDAEKRERKRLRRMAFSFDAAPALPPKAVTKKPKPAGAVHRWNSFF